MQTSATRFQSILKFGGHLIFPHYILAREHAYPVDSDIFPDNCAQTARSKHPCRYLHRGSR